MSNIKLISEGANVAPIYWAILNHPELWNENVARTKDENSPHYELDDIWPRFGEIEYAENGLPHDSKWYPSADILGIKELVFELFHAVKGVELGGVLITRIAGGKECKPHSDPGWHARRYQKFGVQITSAPGQKFCFEDAELETKPGDIFWFDNEFTHWVTNPTPYERITMIVCIRIDKEQ